MTEAGFFQSRSVSPSAVAIVIALHGGLIAAVMMAKMDVVKTTFGHNDPIVFTEPVKPEPVPPPPPQKKVRPQQPQHQSQVDQPKRTFETPIERASFDRGPIIPTHPDTSPGGKIDVPPLPPPVIERAAVAKGDVRTLITADDYPAAALRNDETGSLRARLSIAANGRVSDCAIVETSGSKALDSTTCKILKARARFTPALDSDGLPTAGSYVTPTITWQLRS
jgi:protein TonB